MGTKRVLSPGESENLALCVPPEFTTFYFLKPWKSTWTTRVKILSRWKHYLPTIGESLEMILGDERGSRISAIVKKEHVHKFENVIQVGMWKVIKKISIIKDHGIYKLSLNLYKIVFLYMTTVIDCDPVNTESFLKLAKYDDVLSRKVTSKVLIDIVGFLVSICEMKSILR